MKKRILALAAVVALTLSSCEGLLQNIVDQFLGHAEMTLVEEEGSTEVALTSCVCNVSEDSVAYTAFLAARVDLIENNAPVTVPYLVMCVTDTTVGEYALEPLTLGLFNEESRFNLSTVIGIARSRNLVVLLDADSTLYVSNSGTVSLSEFPRANMEVKGTFSGTLTRIAQADIENFDAVRESIEQELMEQLLGEGYTEGEDLEALVAERVTQMPISRLFPHETAFSGSVSSLRLMRDVIGLLDQ